MTPEDHVHIPILNWIRKNVTRFVWHTPNGGKRGLREALHLKELGVMAGVPDLTFVVNGRAYFIEIKKAKGVTSAEQKTFGRLALEHGAFWAVAKSKEEAIAACIAWGLVGAEVLAS